ncbi:hypothetical protein MnTg02_02776 [bacterium MnTg02]|nr:hypothetical protein MnTg02_02776 [bacterium MnTg02]
MRQREGWLGVIIAIDVLALALQILFERIDIPAHPLFERILARSQDGGKRQQARPHGKRRVSPFARHHLDFTADGRIASLGDNEIFACRQPEFGLGVVIAVNMLAFPVQVFFEPVDIPAHAL